MPTQSADTRRVQSFLSCSWAHLLVGWAWAIWTAASVQYSLSPLPRNPTPDTEVPRSLSRISPDLNPIDLHIFHIELLKRKQISVFIPKNVTNLNYYPFIWNRSLSLSAFKESHSTANAYLVICERSEERVISVDVYNLLSCTAGEPTVPSSLSLCHTGARRGSFADSRGD